MRDLKSIVPVCNMVAINIMVFLFVISLFFKIEPTIIAGIIGFLGAIFGGLITYLGVKQTLRHRDKELFMDLIGKKIFQLEDIIDNKKKPINTLFLAEQINDPKNDVVVVSVLNGFIKKCKEAYKKIGKYMIMTLLLF